MRTKRIPVLVATGVLGLALGTGVGLAAARPASSVLPPTTNSSSMMGSSTPAAGVMGTAGSMHGGTGSFDMGAMHAAMRDQMPSPVRQQCDALHAQMTAGTTDSHAAHHPTR